MFWKDRKDIVSGRSTRTAALIKGRDHMYVYLGAVLGRPSLLSFALFTINVMLGVYSGRIVHICGIRSKGARSRAQTIQTQSQIQIQEIPTVTRQSIVYTTNIRRFRRTSNI